MLKSLFGIELNKAGYKFPLSNGGGIQGINDAGVETFKGNPNMHLAKEIIQNSLDAKAFDKPVRVVFDLKEIQTEEIPYVNELKESFESCKKFWEKENDKKTLEFINCSLGVLGKGTIKVLEISDYNTTGLRGARKSENNVFAKLVTDSGVSNKVEGSGGSFGIGKNAPYTCSDLRTVLYSTLDDEDVKAIQGVSRLVSHRDKDGHLTQGKGFLGMEDKNEYGDIINHPFVHNSSRNDIGRYIENGEFIRKEQGTSIYILGYSGSNLWEEEIIIAILDFYMVSIANGNLEVIVGENLISKDTLEFIINKYKQKVKDTFILQYYRAYMGKGDNTKKITHNFDGMGEIDLYLILEEEICNKKVAYVRNNGMKIIDKDRIKVMCKFNGVLVFRGREINEFIRSLENPSHDKIEPERHIKPTRAKEILRKLSNFIRDTINELSCNSSDEIIEMEGLGKYLPVENENKLKVDFKETIHKKIKHTKMKKVEKLKKAKKINSDEAEEESLEIGSGQNGSVGREHEILASDTTISKEGTPENRKEDSEKKDNMDEKLKAIIIEKSRVMAISNNIYKVIIKSKSKGKVYVGINLIGEVGAEGAKLLSAKNVNDNTNYEIKKSYFGPVEFQKDELKKFEIEIKGNFMYSMEVETSADNR